jgi:hypothetical protein
MENFRENENFREIFATFCKLFCEKRKKITKRNLPNSEDNNFSPSSSINIQTNTVKFSNAEKNVQEKNATKMQNS